jgi:biopolymer transport protein TolR
MLAEINVVPYIDVMLVLLVIFMVTAPMLMQGVEVDLPDAVAAPVDNQDAEPLIVSINDRGPIIFKSRRRRKTVSGTHDHSTTSRSGIATNARKTRIDLG